ncbi:MAG: sigma 54-interacting transcriptional regulator, partial [Mailhella sp.]|nr:sigma 54-interacting transcriptional regulator [Mailhella sp.]
MSQFTNQDPSAAAPWLETLRLMSISLGPGRAFQSGITALLRLLTERHGFLRPHLVLYDPETETLRLSVAEALPRDNHGDYTPGVGITGQVFATGKSAIVEKIKGDPVFMSLLFQRTDEEMEKLSFISVPILAPSREGPFSAREVIGTLNADTERADRSDLEYRRLFLEVMAAYIANEAAHLQEEHGRRLRSSGRAADEDYSAAAEHVFVAQSKIMRHILDRADAMASSSAPLLLCGEPGTGKETLAARIHSTGSRREAPMVVCHCASIPSDRMLMELCGFQKGAVLGANHTQKGLFEKANTGTIFLDAVEYLSREAQESLLRLIKNREVLRYGASDPVLVDTRVIASSGADLDDLASKGLFSAELCERLKVNAVRIPPLRERREDIVPLVEHLLAGQSEEGENSVKRISL